MGRFEFRPYLRDYEMRNGLDFARTLTETAAALDAAWNDYSFRRARGVPAYFRRVEFLRDARDVRPMRFGQEIAFNWGEFDRHAAVAYARDEGGDVRVAFASDKYYFEILAWFGETFGRERVWRDVMSLYRATAGDRSVRDAVFVHIAALVATYPEDVRDGYYNALMHLYYGMVAEEMKSGTVLGRRVKMQGLSLILLFNWPPEAAADWSRGRSAEVVDAFAQEVGVVPDDARRVMPVARRRAVIAAFNEREAASRLKSSLERSVSA